MTRYITGYDGSAAARAALRFTTTLAERTGAEVIAADVFRTSPRIPTPGTTARAADVIDADSRREAEGRLAMIGEPDVAHCAVGATSPAAGLHALAADQDAALVAVGLTHRGTLGRLVLGSVGDHLLHGSPCAVAVVPPQLPDAIRTIGVAYDGGEEARGAVATAADLARALGARVVVIAVHEAILTGLGAPGMAYAPTDLDREVREELVREVDGVVEGLTDVEAEARVLDGPAAATLVATAEHGLDLLVTGSRGYGPHSAVLLGSVSRHVVDHAPCPVIVLPRGAGRRLTSQAPAAMA